MKILDNMKILVKTLGGFTLVTVLALVIMGIGLFSIESVYNNGDLMYHEKAIPLAVSWRMAILICVAGMIILGTIFAPLYGWSTAAAAGLF